MTWHLLLAMYANEEMNNYVQLDLMGMLTCLHLNWHLYVCASEQMNNFTLLDLNRHANVYPSNKKGRLLNF